MWWTRRSENRFGWFDRAALGRVEEPLATIWAVVSDGAWQCAYPIRMKMALPFSVDGVAGAGSGGRQHPHEIGECFNGGREMLASGARMFEMHSVSR